jgi:hypothetical protein
LITSAEVTKGHWDGGGRGRCDGRGVDNGIPVGVTMAKRVASPIEPEAPVRVFALYGLEQKGLNVFLETLPVRRPMKKVVPYLRRYVPVGPWTALTLPSGKSAAIGNHLSSPDYLRTAVVLAPHFPRPILQTDASGSVLHQNRSLGCVFSAFGTALANAVRWPGIPVWTPCGDSLRLQLLKLSVEDVDRNALWLFARLYDSRGDDLAFGRTTSQESASRKSETVEL